MAVRKGYKLTDIGEIPEDWEVKELHEIATVSSGKRLPKGYYLQNNRTNCPYIRIIDLYNGGILLNNIKYVPSDISHLISAYRVYENDIIISVAGTLGLICKIPKILSGANLTENADRIYNIKCDIDFLKFILQSDYVKSIIESIKTTAAQPKLALERIRKFKITIPANKSEQADIASSLSDIDSLISSLEHLIAKKRLIKQGAMQELLTGKKRLPGFGSHWKKYPLLKAVDVYQPKTIPEYLFTKHGYPVYGANGKIGFYHSFNHNSWQTILTCRGSTCGTINKTVAECWITGNAMVLNCDANKKIDKDFFYYLMCFNDFTKFITGSGQPQIVREALIEMNISFPENINEQAAIATVLSDMDDEIAALEAKLAKTRQIKSGMMEELLTGRIRLV